MEKATCEVCRQHEARYRCPGCQTRSCSLDCVAAHKRETGCTGKRDRTTFLSRADLDERALISDYAFLEEVQLAEDVAHRCRPAGPCPGMASRSLPRHLQSLVFQAQKRGVCLLLQPAGLHLRKTNTTRFDPKKQMMLWRVAWRFRGGPPREDVVDPRAAETATIQELLAAHARVDGANGKCDGDERRGCGQGEDLQEAGPPSVLIKKHRTPANAPLYYRINTRWTLAEALRGKEIVEFPVFTVVSDTRVLADYTITE